MSTAHALSGRRPIRHSLVIFLVAGVTACSDPPQPPDAPAAGSGGSTANPATGGKTGSGGTAGTAGSAGAGGAPSTGGAPGTATGGTPGAGGSPGTGGAGAGGAGGTTSTTDAGNDVADGSDGTLPANATPAQIYAGTCSVCHGPDGAGTKLAPEIRHPPRNLLAWAVRMGREGKGFPAPMLPYTADKISDAAVTGIADLLWAQPRPTDAQGLYLDFCGNCHGPDGKGGSVAEVAFGKKATEIDDIVRAGHGGTNLANRPKWMPAFSTTDLPDADLAAIKTFLNAR
jgi:mono/diheme cytochrome c family protein